MQVLDARVSSFPPISRPKSRAKPAFPLSHNTHPHLTPQNLAEAGFYHASTQRPSGFPDICRCYLCDVQLGGWDPNDDPFEEHVKRQGCAWADLVCALKVDGRKDPVNGGRKRTVYPNPESLPSSSQSAVLREQTYQKDGKTWWPHKKKKDWLPTVTALAKAGFIYTPTASDKDNATCPLCQYSVEGWEATDDPWDVHQIKFPECPFFTATVDPSYGKVQVGPEEASKSSRTSAKLQGSKKNVTSVDMPIEAEVGESAVDEEVAKPPSRTTAKFRTTLRTSQNTGRTRRKAVEADAEESAAVKNESKALTGAEEEEEVSKPLRKTKGRPIKGWGKKRTEPDQMEEETERVEERRATIKPSHHSQPPPSEPHRVSQLDRFANVPPSSPAIPITPKSKSRSRSAKLSGTPREVLDSSVQDGAIQARRVIEDLSEGAEQGIREPLSDSQRGMTLEELVRSEMQSRYEAMELEGEALIGKWEQRTRESRLCVEGI